MEDKKRTLILSSNSNNIKYFSELIVKHLESSLIFEAHDFSEALFKIENSPPHIVVIDSEHSKSSSIDIAEKILTQKACQNSAVIVVTPIPDKEHFIDEIVTGKVQFLTNPQYEDYFSSAFYRALNFVARVDKNASYSLRYVLGGDALFNEGDEPDFAYVVRKGRLKAVKMSDDKVVELGQILEGEFVGEMAHITGGKRSATIKAISDCELIEIPYATLDAVLFTKPAWAKALVVTLTRRLKKTNQALVEDDSN